MTANWIPDVEAATTIESSWGNTVRDRTAPPGLLGMWLTSTPPAGWLICNGQAVSRSTYADLFDLWGETFGEGNGSTTFNLPDFRNRFLVGQGTNTGDVGATGGTWNHVHTIGSHTHSVPNTSTAGNHNHVAGIAGTTDSAGSHSHTAGTLATASAGSHNHGGATGQANANNGTRGSGAIESVVLNHTHSISSAGSHTHSISGSTASAGAHTHTFYGEGTTTTNGNHSHTIGNTGSGGSGETGGANPPFLAVHVIVKV